MSENTLKKSLFSVREICFIGLFAVVITICSWISVPMTVPFTLQTFAVFCSLLVLGGKNGLFAVVTYILLGAFGLPVFSGFKGGAAALLGPTGGYIIGFVFTALIYIAFTRRSDKLILKIIALFLGMAAYFSFGTVWFKLVYTAKNGEMTYIAALSLCVFPFIIPDTVKLALAVVFSEKIKKYIRRSPQK